MTHDQRGHQEKCEITETEMRDSRNSREMRDGRSRRKREMAEMREMRWHSKKGLQKRERIEGW